MDYEVEHREKIVQDIARMDAMIAGVLAFVRGERAGQRERLDLAALVQAPRSQKEYSGSGLIRSNYRG